MIGESTQSIRLPGTEQRYPVSDQFPVEYAIQTGKGEPVKLVRYTVIILKGK